MKITEVVNNRETITGKVTRVYSVPHFKYPNKVTWKLAIDADDGRKMSGSVPANLNVKPGDKIQFNALVQTGKSTARQFRPLEFKRPTGMKRI